MALDRAKKLAGNDDLVQIAQMHYDNAMSDYRKMVTGSAGKDN